MQTMSAMVPEGFGPGGWGHLAYAIGICFAVFQLIVAAWNFLPSQAVRGIHVGFLILLTFGLKNTPSQI